MIGFLTFMKALFLFIREIYSNDDALAPKDRKQKIVLFVFLIVAISLGYMGTMYVDHEKNISDSKIEVLEAELELSEKGKAELEYQLLQERSYGDRVDLILERSYQEVRNLNNQNERLEEANEELIKEINKLRDSVNSCVNLDPTNLYDRLMELNK